MNGEPLPYLLRTDSVVVFVLFFCVILVAYILLNNKKYLSYKLKDLLGNREKNSRYIDITADSMHYSFLLVLHACALWGICIYGYLINNSPEFLRPYSPYFLLGLIFCMIIFVLLKSFLYSFINWVFFDKMRNASWIKTYYNVFIWSGLLLLPIVLLLVLGDLSLNIFLYWLLFVVIIMKIVLFFKCFDNFFKNFHGCFHLILYLCALEFLPGVLLWKSIWVTNHFLLQF